MSENRKETILIIQPDRRQSLMIRNTMEEAGFQVVDSCHGDCVKTMIEQVKPVLVILDWDLEDVTTAAVIRTIRLDRYYTDLPIILTGMDFTIENKIRSLEGGADLCLEGVIHPKELVARVRALVRRASIARAASSWAVKVGRA